MYMYNYRFLHRGVSDRCLIFNQKRSWHVIFLTTHLKSRDFFNQKRSCRSCDFLIDEILKKSRDTNSLSGRQLTDVNSDNWSINEVIDRLNSTLTLFVICLPNYTTNIITNRCFLNKTRKFVIEGYLGSLGF